VIKLQIEDRHIDSFGHVNNAAYLTLYEEARWKLIEGRGFSAADIRQRRKGPIVLEINIKFLRELKAGDEVVVDTEILSYEGKIGKMRQSMTKPDGTVASEATFVFGLFDLDTRKLVEPTPEWKAAIGFI
jgi:YbgC/YbaW family acyl-CoA thioester hydrolase